VHLGFATEFGDTHAEGPPVDPDGLAKRVVTLEDGSETEGKYGGIPKAAADHAGMVNCRFLIQLSGIGVVFAHYHSKLAAGIAEDWGSIHALDVFDDKGASGTGAVGKGLVLGKAIRVPRHFELSEPGRGGPTTSYVLHKLNCNSGS